MKEIGDCEAAHYDPADDVERNTRAILRLRPHEGFSREHGLAIQHDFEMEGGVCEIEVRLAMAYYFIKRMNLDLEDHAPSRAQMRLENSRQVEKSIELARLETKERISAGARKPA